MQGAAQHAFSRSRFSCNQHVDIAGSDFAGEGENLLHVLAEAHQVVEPVQGGLRRAQLPQLQFGAVLAMGAAQHHAQFHDVGGIDQNVVGAAFDHQAGNGRIIVAQENDDGGSKIRLPEFFNVMLVGNGFHAGGKVAEIEKHAVELTATAAGGFLLADVETNVKTRAQSP